MATIADELNAISVEHGYTGAAPKTIAGAIDALADTLAGTDVEERRTIAGAVKALAPYIGGGGGGSLGALQDWPKIYLAVPAIGDSVPPLSQDNGAAITGLKVGGVEVFGPLYYEGVEEVPSMLAWSTAGIYGTASGVTLSLAPVAGSNIFRFDTQNPVFYAITVNYDSYTIASVRALNIPYQVGSVTIPNVGTTAEVTFDVPELMDMEGNGEVLVIKVEHAD